jgi:acyl-CoA synthetase (AMP-forming)/AMP-acid ligase II
MLMETRSNNTAIPWQTIPAMLAEIMARNPGKTAVVDGAIRLNYAALQQRMCLAAAEIRALGLGPGDVVAFWAPNSWQWVVGVLACWWCGCVVAPIPARGRILDAMPILKATRAKLLFTCSISVQGNYPEQITRYLAELNSDLKDVCPTLQTIVDVSGHYRSTAFDVVEFAAFAECVAAPEAVSPALVSASDECEILFTSGSTGTPKGVLRRHEQVLGNRWSSSIRRGFKAEDVLLAISEFSHTLGLNGTLLRGLLLGATLVLSRNRNPQELAVLIQGEGITAISAAPSLFSSLLKQRVDGMPVCKHLRLASIGSARIPPELVRQLLDVGVESVVSGYGMTECDSIASAGLTERADIIATTVGHLEEGVEVQITDDEGLAVPPGGSGEIWIRGYAVSPAYLTASGQHTAVAGEDGWFRSGDIGRWTSDGYLQILGRKKEVICIHGYNLYPMELEALLSQSEMLDEVAVMGAPHTVAGEICVAFIVPRDSQGFSLQELRRWARKHMADYKIPGRFVVVDSLPLGGNGKVDRKALRNILDA